MKFTFSATVEVFDKEAYMEAVRAEFRRVFMKAGQRFLLAAIPKVPLWTGMLRGAFRNAEDVFGKVTADKQSGGVRIRTTRGKGEGRGGGSNDTPLRKGYYYYPPGGGRIPRTPQAGRQYATQPEQILSLTGAALSSGRTSFYFRFDIDITYFSYQDKKHGILKAGAVALEEYVKANVKLPDPLKFMTRKVISAK